MWERIKSRLGLSDEWVEEYEGFEDEALEDDEIESQDGFYGRSAHDSPFGGSTSVRRASREPDAERYRAPEHARVAPSASETAQVQPQVKMHIVEPKSYGEAQTIADRFKQGTPVIMNMSMTPPDLAKRLLDFASGLTYGLDGGLQKVSDKVFMLTPANVDVSAGDFRRFADRGMFPME